MEIQVGFRWGISFEPPFQRHGFGNVAGNFLLFQGFIQEPGKILVFTLGLAGASTLCRLEKRMGRASAVALHEVLIDRFIASHVQPPKELILDFDATDDPVHGHQLGRFYHGYYNGYCFLPLYVFCGKHLLAGYLRPSNIDAAYGSWSILKLLSDRFREVWPDVKIIFRADSGFCRHLMMDWCDKNNIEYIIGIARNSRLESMSSHLMETAIAQFGTFEQYQGRHSWSNKNTRPGARFGRHSL